MEHFVRKIEELEAAAEAALKWADRRLKFFLSGDLGAGKTTFAKAFCKKLGVKDQVTSPTFSLVNEYVFVDDDGHENIIRHLDLYRLKNLQEAMDIGIEDFLYDTNYCLVEWPEIIETIAPEDVVRIIFSLEADSSRKILFL